MASAPKARTASGKKNDTGVMNSSREQLLKYYRDMLLIRRFEERAGQLYGMGLIGGFCHLYIGQEAIAVGMEAIRKPGDQIITGYRDHGHMLAAGMSADEVMAELTGRSGGSSKGKGGSMHMFDVPTGFYGGHGIVGAQVALGTGLALADKYRDNGAVSYTYFGDGAANQGQVYESFNMAELWSLPVVYVIENNQYAMGTSIERSSSETRLHKRGVSFNIPGEEVDGMDVEAVAAAGARAAKYRTKEEVDEVKKTRDPIEHLKEKLATVKVTDDELKAIDAEVKAIVAQAAEYARTSPEPDPSELYTDVYLEAAQ